jgi:probable F420-dependent oxidoreductase
LKLGITFPQTQIGNDPSAIRDYFQTVEGAGFDYVGAYEHVIGAHPDRFREEEGAPFTRPAYFHYDAFHEPLTLFAYVAALTSRIELMTHVLVLPQRQTALVAKQAAEVDILSGGRLRLGIGVGWNFTEYEALGQDYRTRGAREEEQIVLLRRLWTEELVTLDGRFDRLDRVGINPRLARSIPIWLGGGTDERVMERAARLADGWVPFLPPTEETVRILDRLRALLDANGRDPSLFGLQVNLSSAGQSPSGWLEEARFWQRLGVTHLGLGGYSRDESPGEALKLALEKRKVLSEAIG